MKTSIAASLLVLMACTPAPAQTVSPAPQAGPPSAGSPPAGPQMVPVRRMRTPTPPPAYTGDRGQTAMTMATVYPIVDVTIQGRPFRFLVDTGAAGHGRIKPAVAEALGLAVTGTLSSTDGSGRFQDRRNFALPELDVGGVRFSNLDMSEYVSPPGRGEEFDGILGLSLFGNHTLTLDYAGGQMRLDRDPLPETAMRFDGSRGQVIVPISIASETIATAIDTGNAVASLILPAELVQRLPRRGEARAAGVGRTGFSTIEMFEVDLAAPARLGDTTLPVSSVGYPSLGPNGNLGSRALATGVLKLDQRNSRIELTFGGQ